MTLQGIKDFFSPSGPPVFRYFATGQIGNYIVWAEDGEGSSGHADNQKNHSSNPGHDRLFHQDRK